MPPPPRRGNCNICEQCRARIAAARDGLHSHTRDFKCLRNAADRARVLTAVSAFTAVTAATAAAADQSTSRRRPRSRAAPLGNGQTRRSFESSLQSESPTRRCAEIKYLFGKDAEHDPREFWISTQARRPRARDLESSSATGFFMSVPIAAHAPFAPLRVLEPLTSRMPPPPQQYALRQQHTPPQPQNDDEPQYSSWLYRSQLQNGAPQPQFYNYNETMTPAYDVDAPTRPATPDQTSAAAAPAPDE
jgi:hypothetical protein